MSWPLVDVLPGGKIINGAQALIDLHNQFFQSDATSFEPLDEVAREFNDSDIAYEIDSEFNQERGCLGTYLDKKPLSVRWRRSA